MLSKENSLLQVLIYSRKEADSYQGLFEICPHALAQQSVHWADIISPLSPDTPYFLVVCNIKDQQVFGGLVLYHYEGKFGGILTSVPHAGPLGGILCPRDLDGTLKKQVYSSLVDCALQLADKLKCISLTIITNPFLDDAELYKTRLNPDYILNNFCQVNNLSNIFNDSGRYNVGHSNYNSNINKSLSKASKNGVIIEWAHSNDFELWYSIHLKRHTELGALPLPRPLLENIISVLNPFKMGNLAIVKINDHIVGGCIFIWNKEIADFYIISSDSDYMKCGINHAVIDFAIRYFHSIGIKWFNWQSSQRNSGVYIFKKRWGSEEKPYQFLTWIFSGFEKVLSTSVEEISKAYQWHYVAPFEAIKNKLNNGVFNKN